MPGAGKSRALRDILYVTKKHAPRGVKAGVVGFATALSPYFKGHEKYKKMTDGKIIIGNEEHDMSEDPMDDPKGTR